jgi:hypothetical protein
MITMLTRVPGLHYFDHGRKVIIKTNASEYISGGVVSQQDDDGVLHSIA